MGRYCTTTSLATLWGGADFTDLTATATLMIDQAEAEIDKMLSARYNMASDTFQTSTSIPPMVTVLAQWLSLGYLYEQTARGSKDSYARADRYIKKAMSNIDKILEHKYNLVDASGDLIADNTTELQILSTTSEYSNTFNEDDPLDWNVNTQKLDDIFDERE